MKSYACFGKHAGAPNSYEDQRAIIGRARLNAQGHRTEKLLWGLRVLRPEKSSHALSQAGRWTGIPRVPIHT